MLAGTPPFAFADPEPLAAIAAQTPTPADTAAVPDVAPWPPALSAAFAPMAARAIAPKADFA